VELVVSIQDQNTSAWRNRWRNTAQRIVLALTVTGVTAASAILVKERSSGMPVPLVAVDIERTEAVPSLLTIAPSPDRFERPAVQRILATPAPADAALPENQSATRIPQSAVAPAQDALSSLASTLDPQTRALAQDPDIRWFDGRPARPKGRIWMTVTAYSPDTRSCGPDANGHTATLHSVFTNGMKLVAADTRILPFGTMLSIPGYDDNHIVPVLDRGGAIKGNKLDLLFPTDEEARQWGRKRMLVTVWEYADGKPAVDPRKLR
jgi:3D (Asp-Asp-Asp) domain-containing protein